MYDDRSLIPKEAVRMAALGLLAEDPLSYGDLASQTRTMTQLFVGPSLEMMAPSIELLKLEGLVETVPTPGDDRLQLTRLGLETLLDLVRAPIRRQVNDVNRMILALKLQHLHRLPREERLSQLDGLLAAFEGEAARLHSLADRIVGDRNSGEAHLAYWIELESRHMAERIDLCRQMLQAEEQGA